ncbi:hypothetical protein F7734_29075 [Scytonema sp. UIC 10036]|uniref:hypothetical protein n=1 Tax=Scytonema sp. UIC 10036 TaxID=2304196 RepID=UPI0012DA7E59|nr:hypothetical protein [Scytonema sp. UIC 10036]MUG96174.1 hypothetical protein [Scytonema sp. UIC 10036]
MVQTVTSHDYPNLGVFESHSVLTGRLITMGRVVQCSKGYLPQVKHYNKWINVSSSLPTSEEARKFLFTRHYAEAQAKRGWTDEQLQEQVLKVEEKNLKMWSSRLQKRMQIQKQLDANLEPVRTQIQMILDDPHTQTLTARKLLDLIIPLCSKIFFPEHWVERTKSGAFRTLQHILRYCDDIELQQQRLRQVAELD